MAGKAKPFSGLTGENDSMIRTERPSQSAAISLAHKFSRPIDADPALSTEPPLAVTGTYGCGSIELISYHDSRGPGGDRKD
jgi:hypothetical protein